jgi:hypothetical protein
VGRGWAAGRFFLHDYTPQADHCARDSLRLAGAISDPGDRGDLAVDDGSVMAKGPSGYEPDPSGLQGDPGWSRVTQIWALTPTPSEPSLRKVQLLDPLGPLGRRHHSVLSSAAVRLLAVHHLWASSATEVGW